MKTPKLTVSARISQEDYKNLLKKSQDFNLTRTSLIRAAIEEYLEKQKTPQAA